MRLYKELFAGYLGVWLGGYFGITLGPTFVREYLETIYELCTAYPRNYLGTS